MKKFAWTITTDNQYKIDRSGINAVGIFGPTDSSYWNEGSDMWSEDDDGLMHIRPSLRQQMSQNVAKDPNAIPFIMVRSLGSKGYETIYEGFYARNGDEHATLLEPLISFGSVFGKCDRIGYLNRDTNEYDWHDKPNIQIADGSIDLSGVEDVFSYFKENVSLLEVNLFVDYWIKNESKFPAKSWSAGGAHRAALGWLLGKYNKRSLDIKRITGSISSMDMVDKLMEYYEFDDQSVSPKMALRLAMEARLLVRDADKKLSEHWFINKDLIDAVVIKLDKPSDVYDLDDSLLDTMLGE